MDQSLKRAEELFEQAAVTPERVLLPPDRFVELAGREVQRAGRYDRPLSVAMIQVDRLSVIRTADGDAVADEVLEAVAEMLGAALRGPDRTGRLGPTELGVLLPETPLTRAEEVAERLVTRVAGHPLETSGGAREVTLSVGVAGLSPRMNNPKSLMMTAYLELRRAQSRGRNQVCKAEPDRVRLTIPRSGQLH